jgi:hypothetical protein
MNYRNLAKNTNEINDFAFKVYAEIDSYKSELSALKEICAALWTA